MKDEGLETKSIENAGSSNAGSSDEDLFEIISVDPPDGSYNVNKDIRIKFTFNKELREYGTGSQGDCNRQVFKISTDRNFNGKNCLGFNDTCGFPNKTTEQSGDGKTLSVCNPSLGSNTVYYIRVLQVPRS